MSTTTEIHFEDENASNNNNNNGPLSPSTAGGSNEPSSTSAHSDNNDHSKSSNNDRRERGDRRGTSRTLFVGNIPYETSEDQIREVFDKFGPILRVAMCSMDKKKKESGYAYCFVEYEILRDSEDAYEKLRDYKIGERTIKLDYDFGRKQRGGAGGGRGGGRGDRRRSPPRGGSRYRSPPRRSYGRYDDDYDRRDDYDRYDRRDDRRDDYRRDDRDDYRRDDRDDYRRDDRDDRDDYRRGDDRRDSGRDSGRERRGPKHGRRYEPYGSSDRSPNYSDRSPRR